MVGGDESLVVMNEWAAPSPSPRSFFSSLLKDGISAISCSNMAQDNRKQWPPSVAYEQKAATSMDEEGNENGSEEFGAGDSLSETMVLSVQKPSPRSSFSERMASRGGFNTPKPEHYKSQWLVFQSPQM
uniref:WRKY transcription factor n=1 Tax=Piper nigrum TaxID=13216 RepID=A0A168SQH9_PIPNI|nr:WRKY transcription factor [Piper nigrum]